jgi:1,4-dihydroxy-2-naphthoate octaprenyltransferase
MFVIGCILLVLGVLAALTVWKIGGLVLLAIGLASLATGGMYRVGERR